MREERGEMYGVNGVREERGKRYGERSIVCNHIIIIIMYYLKYFFIVPSHCMTSYMKLTNSCLFVYSQQSAAQSGK